MRRRRLLAAAAAAVSAGAWAGPRIARAQPGAGWQAVFADWAARHRVARGAIVTMRQGRAVHASGLGGQAPAQRAPVWSLSKLVTGVAVGQLIAEGRLTLDTPLGAAMPLSFAAQRVPADGPLGSLRLAELLSHRTGLPTRIGGEAVPGLRALLELRGTPAAAGIDGLRPVLFAARPDGVAGASFAYSNTNFLLLGLMLAEQRGRAYATDTAERVLAPAGIRRAGLDPDWHVLDATGGWRLSPAEYLAFLWRVFGPASPLPAPLAGWMRDPSGKATLPDAAVHYALGAMVRPVRGGANFFHTGSWTYRLQTRATAIAASAGSRFAFDVNGSAWCAVFSPYPGSAASAELDRLMWGPFRTPAGDAGRDLLPALLRGAA